MKRIIPIAVAVLIVGLCLLVAAYFCHYYYTLNQYTALQLKGMLESRIDSLEGRAGRLEAHKPRHLIPIRLFGQISTTDEELSVADSQQFHLQNSKGGRSIVPELRLPATSTSEHEFEIHVSSDIGTVVDGWLSHAEPYDDLAAFVKLDVYRGGTNSFRLVVQTKPGSRINMRFTLVVLRSSLDDHEY